MIVLLVSGRKLGWETYVVLKQLWIKFTKIDGLSERGQHHKEGGL
jgi:hypothetical protein